MQHQVSIDIDRPIDKVFDYTNANTADWSLTVVSDDVIEDKGGVGTTFKVVTQDGGRTMDFDGIVTDWQPPTLSAIRLTGKSFDIESRYEFTDLGDGRTRVTQKGKVNPKGLCKVFFALLGWAFHKAGCKAAVREFASLKRHCEDKL